MSEESIILRYTDKNAPKGGTMRAHAEICAAKGYVWYGKIGVPLSRDRLNKIIKAGDAVVFFIEARSGDLFKATLSDTMRSVPDAGSVPAYYAQHYDSVGTWLKLTEISESSREELNRYVIASSGMPIVSTVRNSMSSFFYIRRKNGGTKRDTMDLSVDCDLDLDFDSLDLTSTPWAEGYF